MGDIYCKVCGEPWDAYGVRHGDMTPREANAFLKGLGCPCCKGVPPEGRPAPQREREFLESLVDPANSDEDPIELLDQAFTAGTTGTTWSKYVEGR